MKKVTFGIVNCNRLFYLKSCLESLVDTTMSYPVGYKELIVVDNASVEQGTREYLIELEDRGFTVVRKRDRNPANEFAIGLNTVLEKSTGDYVCLLQGDMQFVLNDWLTDVVDFYDKNIDVVGSVMLDAQRRSRLLANIQLMQQFSNDRQPTSGKNVFFGDMSRGPVGAAGDVVFSRQVLEQIGPWNEKNTNHEGSMDSETEMRVRVDQLVKDGKMPRYVMALSSVPQSVAIYTDPRGTQGRVRGNKRYGKYWQAKDSSGWKYYDYVKESDFSLSRLNSIEDLARPIGFAAPVDFDGNWLKNPVRPETASSDDWVAL